ncbi:MAG: M14 family zinc carboxypeptidase [Actinomycetota bacterium]
MSRRELLRRGAVTGAGLVVGTALPASRALAAEARTPSDEPLRLARVWPVRGGLPPGLDDTHRVFDDGSIEVLLWPGELEQLRAAGARFTVTETDVVARGLAASRQAAVRTPGLDPQPGERTDYRRLADVENDLRQLAEANPGKARLLELPFTTFEGRRVLGLEIARNVNAIDARPTFHVDGVHHAREWPAVEMSIMWAYDLLTNDGVDPRITAILDHVRTTVVPVINPDGFNHSRETALGQGQEGVALGGRGQYWRKNRRSLTDYFAGDGLGVAEGASGSQYPAPARGFDAYGVDPNRNYAYTWGRPGSSSSDIHSQAHRGDSPYSEPESRNIGWLMTTRHITGSLTHHTYAQEIIWPWANEMGEAPDADLYKDLGDAMADFNGYRARKYNTSEGTTPDALYGAVSCISFLFEHGTSEFHPAYLSYVPATYQSNREAFILITEEMAMLPEHRSPRSGLPDGLTTALGGRKLHHAVLRGRVVNGAGSGVQAELVTRKRFQSPLWLFGDGTAPGGRKEHEEIFEARTRTAPNGTFEWHVNPSTRPHIQRDGGEESYELTVLSPAGGTAREVKAARGDVVELGDLRVV